ncbi:hypothetical protein P3X46_032997 [Hevea brasiliensis]|uniref:Uncharacterized protein n=1 Tax=Hevea brasiliensis TaxID=3981 RepID=A0ABQ9KGA1_HEVBR|nr:uncharacterized protein LOC110641793 [Hevea brasiliensis]KAJ9135871.1 hypothetical protein P3X46_032997 [Hevea brasiliensis]
MFNFTHNLMRKFEFRLENFLNSFTAKTNYGAVAAIATPIVIIAGTCVVFYYAKHVFKSKNDGVFARSMSMGALHGGKLAMERLTDYHQARADAASLNAAESELKVLLEEEQPDFKKLQSAVAKLEMSGKEAVAVGILESAVKKARMEEKPQEAYEIEMLLVEMLIYKGDYDKALKCECLSHEEISDARRPLYKAIIHIMLDSPKEEASKYWEEFTEVRTHFQSPPISQDDDQSHQAITNFNEFGKVVDQVLKKDITKAHTKR